MKILSRTCSIALLLTMLFTTVLQAQPFHIENTTAHAVKVAVAYQSKSGMVYEGWYAVNPKAKATFDVPTTAEHMAWYAESPEGFYWGGDDSNAADMTVTITTDNFKVLGNASPKGTTRKARFKNIPLSMGAYHVRITD